MARSASIHGNDAAARRSRRAILSAGAAGALGVIALDSLTNATAAQAATITGGVFGSGFAPAVVTLSQSGGSVAVDASQGNVFALPLSASGWQIANPTNPVGDGQFIRIRISQDVNGGRTVSWGSAFNWGTNGGTPNNAPTLSTTPHATDILTFEYVAALSQWCYLDAAFPQNFGGTNTPVNISVVQSVYIPFNIEGNFNNPVTSGNSIILVPGLYTSASSGSFSTSNPQFGAKGNTVPGTLLTEGTGPIVTGAPGYGYTGLWLLPDVAGGGTFVRVDCTIPSPGAPLGMFAYEVAGLGTNPQLDPAGGVSSGTGTVTTVASGACPAITQSQEIIFGFGHIYDVTLNAPSGSWNTAIGGGVQNFWAGYQIATSPGARYSWTQTANSTGSWGAAVAAICPQPSS
jgi:hypothetical protein